MRPIALDLHVEDVLVREPARLHRDELLDEPRPQRHEREPGRREQVLDGAADDDVSRLRRVERQRADPLVAVDEHQRAVLTGEPVDRFDVVHRARPVRDERRADERGPLVDRGGVGLRVGLDVDDLGAAQLLGVGDLADRRELVRRDHDPVPLAPELERADEPADRSRDGGLDRDVVRSGAEELRERGSGRLRALDPVPPLRAVLVPAGEVLLVRRADGVGERTLRARVDVDLVAEDREPPSNRLANLSGWDDRCQTRL